MRGWITGALGALIALAATPTIAQVVSSDVSQLPATPLPSPDWSVQPADGDKAPGVGGRINQRYRIGTTSAVLASFDLVSRATFSAQAADFTDVSNPDSLYGAGRLTYTGTTTNATQARPASALATPVNVNGQIIRWWAKPVANISSLQTYTIRLYSTGSPSAPGANYVSYAQAGDIKTAGNVPGGGEGRWLSFSASPVAFTAVGTGADLSAITFAVIDIKASTTATPLTIALGNVEVVPNGLTKAKMILSFDDNYPATVAYASRAMARYGFRGVLYPSIALDIGKTGKLPVQQLKNLHDYLGWQVASQAYTTESNIGAGGIDTMTNDQRTAEMSKLRNMQNGLGLSGGADGSYFSNVGVTDMIAYPMFRQHFRTMRAYYFGEFAGAETYPWGDPMRIRSMGAGEFQWGNNAAIYTTYWKNLVDRAIAQKGVGFLTFHDGLNGGMSNWQPAFDALMAYLDSKRAEIDVVTVQDLEAP